MPHCGWETGRTSGGTRKSRCSTITLLIPLRWSNDCVPSMPFYLWTTDPIYIVSAFIAQGVFGGSIYGQMPSYLSERFPTEVRATASGFIYHQGAIWGGLVAPVLSYLAVQMNFGFAMPMMISTILSLVLVVFSVWLGPETKGKRLTADLEVVKVAAQPAT